MAARLLGINRKKIYYKHLLPNRDFLVKKEIEKLHLDNPAYGHKRVALALKYGKNKVQRIMKKFNLHPPRRKGKKIFLTRSVNSHHYTNLIKGMVTTKPGQIFASDLTYIKFQNRNIYLATIEDIFTREIVSSGISDKHDSNLVLSTIQQMLRKKPPEVFHTDQGSEFMAQNVTGFLENNGIRVSVSDKGSPW